MKWYKKLGISLLVILGLAYISLNMFMYQATHGFATYEEEIPVINFPAKEIKILVFSKTTGFRHGEAIEAFKEVIDSIGISKDYFIYQTESAGVFNPDQLHQFDIVIWNNSTGPVLTDQQRQDFKEYITSGGNFLGIHGAGDSSHKWEWYVTNMICAHFSHHPIKKHIQDATVTLSTTVDSTWAGPPVWLHSDEWYVFEDQPNQLGANVLYRIDGTKIDPNGNLLWMTGKEFGMGSDHPVAWYKKVGQGKSFYTSMGHNKAAIKNKNFVRMIEEGLDFLIK